MTGDRLTPSHTKTRAGKRLRYYVSHRLIRNSGEKSLSGWRLPAPALENTVAHLVRRHLETPSFAASLMPDACAAELQHCTDRQKALMDQEANPHAATLLHLAGRVDLAPGQITLTLDAAALADLLETTPDRFSPAALTGTTAFQHRKRGVETRLILAGEPGAQDKVLLRNIAKAQQWWQEIKAGRSFDEIAATAGTSKRRVQQVIGLAFLAPDVVRGQQPVGFTSRWYLRHDLPSDWGQQRQLIRAL